VKPRTSSICQVLSTLRSRLTESTNESISPTDTRSASLRVLLAVTLQVEGVGTSTASVSGRPATSQASSPPFRIFTHSREKPQ
jgi:hypothetical protein